MLVILEGADGSGKSTLASQLANNGYEILRIVRHKPLSYGDMLKLAMDDKIYVMDRGLITAWVYRLLDNEPLDDGDYNSIQLLSLLQYSKFVYCKTNCEFEYSIARGEDNITTQEKSNKLKQIYEFVFQTIKLYDLSPILEYDWLTDDIFDVLTFVKE